MCMQKIRVGRRREKVKEALEGSFVPDVCAEKNLYAFSNSGTSRSSPIPYIRGILHTPPLAESVFPASVRLLQSRHRTSFPPNLSGFGVFPRLILSFWKMSHLVSGGGKKLKESRGGAIYIRSRLQHLRNSTLGRPPKRQMANRNTETTPFLEVTFLGAFSFP